jgi:hypothetical protein
MTATTDRTLTILGALQLVGCITDRADDQPFKRATAKLGSVRHTFNIPQSWGSNTPDLYVAHLPPIL